MACEVLKQKIYDVLKDGCFDDTKDFVDVSDGYDDLVHVVVVSRKFEGKRRPERRDLILNELFNNLSDDEWGLVSLSVTKAPEEVRFCY